MKQIGIFGAGGLAREVLLLLEELSLASHVAAFYETDDVWRERSLRGVPVLPLSRLDSDDCEIVLAIGSPAARRAVKAMLPAQTRYPTLVHPGTRKSASVEIGEGSIVCVGSILTCDIVLGAHVLVDRATNVGHDCRIGDFTTLSPGAIVSGNCDIGPDCFLGTGALIREKTQIAAGAVVGMGAVVVASIYEAGTYIGNPARRHVR